jgi:hypothetical protein
MTFAFEKAVERMKKEQTLCFHPQTSFAAIVKESKKGISKVEQKK